MSAPVPEYSPAMLRLMLEGRAVLARDDTGQTARQFIHGFARLAKVHVRCVHDALAGRLKNAERRARLWAVLGHHPSDHGIVLTDDGGQRHG
ncbi:hypothetical protein IG197_27540 [Aminobacter sp. SR38]|jgi:hypothetical protein|uniref:hypothetical protein n=1 Tax=Aminobacter sp. SR38 TaxID=2774562 RepID=UPI0017805809|nr:hypothetical protein [Aminobacter sp. SR38]QOF71452.1 hypothetical protein IG197_27540 [Aminobacter sp. SR38]